LAQIADEFGVLADALDQNETRALEGGFDIFDALLGAVILFGFRRRIERGVGEQRIGQRLEAGFASDLSFGSPLGLERRVDIFEFDLAVGGLDGALKLGRQLALLGDALEHRDAPVLELCEVAEALFELAQLRVVEPASLLFAVARDEWHGRAFAKQAHGGGDLSGLDIEFSSDTGVDCVHAFSIA
jgi:hypothetical protein